MTKLLMRVACVAVGGFILSSAPALAADDVIRAHNVDYRDLDLSKPSDVAVLQARVSRAAKQVCKADLRDLRTLATVAPCRAEAMHRSRVQIAAARQAATQRMAAVAAEEKQIALK